MSRLDALFSFHGNALKVRSQRQELIAANIANADTPNFKARDIDFSTAMKNAMQGKSGAASGSSPALAQTSSGHLSGVAQAPSNTSAGPNDPLFRPLVQGSVDGNTVDMDVERNQFADNAIRYEASITMLNGQIKQMMSAIQGQ